MTCDPDTPNMGVALVCPYMEEFLEAMGKDISELESHNNWNIMERKSFPEGENILPSTWAFKIKSYPDSILRKLKARFCARGHRQVEGIYYGGKHDPVVSWSNVRMMIII